MTRRLLTRPQARRDIEEAFVFVGEKDEDAGLDFLFAVELTLEMLAENPFLGALRRFAAPELQDVRMWRVKSYEKHLIFYRVDTDGIELLRIIHSSRDYKRVLEDRDEK